MDSRGFTSYFNLVDNFSQKFDAIQKRITSVSKSQYNIDFGIDDAGIVKQTQDLGKKLQESTAGISKAVKVPMMVPGTGEVDKATPIQKTQELGTMLQGSTVINVPAIDTGEADKSITDLQAIYSSLADQTYTTVFDVDDAGAIQKTQELGEKSQESTAGISNAVENAKGVTAGYSDSQKEAGKAVDEHAKATEKAGSAIENLKSKYAGITGSLGSLKTALAGITGLIAGGSVAGFSWAAAEEADDYKKQVMDMLGKRKGSKKVDLSAINAFVAKAQDSGYTSSTDRLQLTNLMIQRGAKTTDQATGATDALEKKYFANQEMLQKDYGVSSAMDLGSMATQKYIRGKQAKQDLDNLFGKGFSNKSQASRIKILTKQGVDIDINATMADKPLEVIQNRFKSITKSIGGELKNVMSPIASMFANILGIIDKNPILPKILAISAVLFAVGGAIVTVGALLPTLTAGFTSLGAVVAILASPITILLVLGALVVYLAYKTGVLQKAWEKFGQSSIGQDIMGALQGISDFVGGLIDQFGKWYEAGGSNQLLGYFFALIDVLGTAWDYMDKLYAMTKTSTANPLIKALFLGIAAPATILAGLGAGAVKAVTGKDPAELLASLLRWTSNYIAPFMAKIHDLTKKLLSIFEWIYSLWQGALSWLKAGLGITKSQAKTKMETEATKEGVTWNQKGDSGAGWYKNGVLQPGSDKLNTLKKNYEKAPSGIFDLLGIADAVAKGMSGIGTIIAGAIKGIVMDIPGMSELAKAIDDLRTWLDNTLGSKGGNLPGQPGNYTTSDENIWNMDASGKYTVTDTNGGVPNQTPGVTIDPNNPPQEVVDHFHPQGAIKSHAVGATFTKGGRFTGNVHSPEEIIPQAVASRGPGPIGKALDLLNNVTAGRNMPSAVTAGAGGDIHIHMPSQDFSGMKVSSNVDFEKVLRAANKSAISDAVLEIKRTIGQGRT